jgi:hypothetical protein
VNNDRRPEFLTGPALLMGAHPISAEPGRRARSLAGRCQFGQHAQAGSTSRGWKHAGIAPFMVIAAQFTRNPSDSLTAITPGAWAL